jgi:hypothetical protein
LSQQHPGRRARVGRRTASLLAPALVGGLVLTYGTPVQAAPASPPNQAAGAAQASYSAGTYLVQLADSPVATDPKTAPKTGKRLNTATDAVRDLVRHLKQERDKVLDAVRGVKPLYTYQYVLNGEMLLASSVRFGTAPIHCTA